MEDFPAEEGRAGLGMEEEEGPGMLEGGGMCETVGLRLEASCESVEDVHAHACIVCVSRRHDYGSQQLTMVFSSTLSRLTLWIFPYCNSFRSINGLT